MQNRKWFNGIKMEMDIQNTFKNRKNWDTFQFENTSIVFSNHNSNCQFGTYLVCSTTRFSEDTNCKLTESSFSTACC